MMREAVSYCFMLTRLELSLKKVFDILLWQFEVNFDNLNIKWEIKSLRVLQIRWKCPSVCIVVNQHMSVSLASQYVKGAKINFSRFVKYTPVRFSWIKLPSNKLALLIEFLYFNTEKNIFVFIFCWNGWGFRFKGSFKIYFSELFE